LRSAEFEAERAQCPVNTWVSSYKLASKKFQLPKCGEPEMKQ
jgi:hypothetical protein